MAQTFKVLKILGFHYKSGNSSIWNLGYCMKREAQTNTIGRMVINLQSRNSRKPSLLVPTSQRVSLGMQIAISLRTTWLQQGEIQGTLGYKETMSLKGMWLGRRAGDTAQLLGGLCVMKPSTKWTVHGGMCPQIPTIWLWSRNITSFRTSLSTGGFGG